MKINILLPYKEQFDKSKLSSVCITVLNNLNHSKFKEEIRIFGRRVTNPAKPKNFVGIKNSFNLFKSRNLNLADQMCKKISTDFDDSQLIEIHNRPKLVKYVLEKTKNKYPINIFFHNNPLDMAGSKSLKERQYLIKNGRNIMKTNFNAAEQCTTKSCHNPNTYYNNKYIFKNCSDQTQPYGYETSDLKKLYLSRKDLQSQLKGPILTQEQLLIKKSGQL